MLTGEVKAGLVDNPGMLTEGATADVVDNPVVLLGLALSL